MKDTDYILHSFTAMGTTCQVQFQASSHATSEAFKTKVSDWVSGFEDQFSRFRPSSIISRINAAAGQEWVEINKEAEALFALCDWFHWSTKGLFDPLLLPLINLWNGQAIPDDREVKKAMAQCGWNKLQRRKGSVFLPEEGMGMDVGGIGKEYAVDRVFEMADQSGIQNILINFGQDLRVQGQPPEGGPWRIGIEDPSDTGQCWAGVAVNNRAITTSGNYRRNVTINGQWFGHIFDPRTGYPVNNGCQAVTVIAPTCTEAGILSTSAFIQGSDEGLQFLDSFHQAEGAIKENNRSYSTRRFNEYLIKN
ncbi:MAG: FAD:protein FMN transferase [bacterium]